MALGASLRDALHVSVLRLQDDLGAARRGLAVGEERLAQRYASSRAPDAWRMVLGLGPLTRAELARALGVTKRTASMAVAVLEAAGLVSLRRSDSVVLARQF